MPCRFNLVPRVSILPVPWSLSLAPGDGKKRDPGNEVGVGLVNSSLTMLLIISFLILFSIPSEMIIIVIELMFLGVNMFLALLRAHFNTRLQLGLK